MISKLFKCIHPSPRRTYAVTTGSFVGEMLIFIKQENNNYYFLSIPKMENREIPIDKFELGLSAHILDVVKDKMSKEIYAVCVKQFDKNLKNDK